LSRTDTAIVVSVLPNTLCRRLFLSRPFAKGGAQKKQAVGRMALPSQL
jgi:hypothetical protein